MSLVLRRHHAHNRKVRAQRAQEFDDIAAKVEAEARAQAVIARPVLSERTAVRHYRDKQRLVRAERAAQEQALYARFDQAAHPLPEPLHEPEPVHPPPVIPIEPQPPLPDPSREPEPEKTVAASVVQTASDARSKSKKRPS